jgi:hypothetical protein
MNIDVLGAPGRRTLLTEAHHQTFHATMPYVQTYDHSSDVALDPVDPSIFDSSYDFDASNEHLCSPISILTQQVQRLVSALQINPLHLLGSYLESLAYTGVNRQCAEENEVRWREQVFATVRLTGEPAMQSNEEENPPPPYQTFARADERILEVSDGGQPFSGLVAPPAYEYPPRYDAGREHAGRLRVPESAVPDLGVPLRRVA